jgi:thioredoxin-related protein
MPRMARSGWMALAILAIAGGRAEAQGVKWRSDYAAARQEATATGRPLLLDFGTEDCFYCRKLDATTFRAPAIVALLNDKFIPVKIDAERAESLSRALNVDSYPTLVLASPDGKVVGRHVGYADIATMTELLEKALARVPATTTAPNPPKSAAAEQLVLARADHDSGRYLACLERCERLAATFPTSPEAADARTLAGQITADPDKSRRVREQLDAALTTLHPKLAAPIAR